jgi:hypothetical protein
MILEVRRAPFMGEDTCGLPNFDIPSGSITYRYTQVREALPIKALRLIGKVRSGGFKGWKGGSAGAPGKVGAPETLMYRGRLRREARSDRAWREIRVRGLREVYNDMLSRRKTENHCLTNWEVPVDFDAPHRRVAS